MPDSDQQPDHLIGVDLGGTKILAGVFDEKLKCGHRVKRRTKAERGPEAVIERIARSVREAIEEAQLKPDRIKAVGVGAPGAVDPQSGQVIFAPNLDWHDIPLRKELEKQTGLPVFVENDCNVCTLGVHAVELEGKPRHLVGIFLGTGIGGGIILDGRLHTGFNRTAGELGHMVLEVNGPKCRCGNRGCFEALASRTAIFRRVQTAVKEGQKTWLVEKLGPELEDMRSGDLRKAIKNGDEFVQEVIEDAAEHTGIAVGNLINIFNPDTVVLGGGIIDQLADEMMPIITETARKHALAGTATGIQIMASQLGDDAGITGAAVLAAKGSA
jgi:glucokinase